MTYEQFWDDDVDLVKYYRKSWKLKQQIKNQDYWLQGAYVYDAMLRVSPILNPFAKKGTKPVPYLEQPYDLFGKGKSPEETQKKAAAEKKSDNKAKAIMEMWMLSVNKKFEEKGGGKNG